MIELNKLIIIFLNKYQKECYNLKIIKIIVMKCSNTVDTIYKIINKYNRLTNIQYNKSKL